MERLYDEISKRSDGFYILVSRLIWFTLQYVNEDTGRDVLEIKTFLQENYDFKIFVMGVMRN